MEPGASLQENWPPVLGGLLDDAPEAHEALVSLLERARLRAVEHVHIEPTEDGARLRLRTEDGFDESRLTEDALLLTALRYVDEHLAPANEASEHVFSVRLADGAQHVSVTRRTTRRGMTRVLTLHGSNLPPPRLDDLIDDARQLHKLREILVRSNGWIAVGTSTRLDGERLVRAIGQELASPDAKLIGIEPTLHPTVARIEQLDRHTTADAIDAFDPDTVLLCATPSDLTLTRLAASAAERRRVVHRSIARQPSAVLSRYLALGLPPNWLEHVLSAVVMRYHVRMLCHGCKRRLTSAEQIEPYAIAASASPDGAEVSNWLKRSLETRFEAGYGCESCDGTGHSGARIITDLLVIDAATRMALRTGDLDSALRRVDSARAINEVLERLIAEGEISPAEAARHLAQRHY